MSTDIAALEIRVSSLEARTAKGDLDKLTDSGRRTEGMVGTLKSAWGQMAGLLGGTAIALAARQFFQVNTEFQRLHAALVTVEGSNQAANRSFGMLLDFAKVTPYQLNEVTQAYINLRVRGLNATKDAMTAYGNMASSFGRSMTDLVQGIAQATVGEMETIKGFGVIAQQMGDKVAFTFKGQTEIVKRSTTAINDYFIRLSQANFAGGMERQAKTLGGALSNLQDQISATFYAIGNAGVSDALTNGIVGLTNALQAMTPTLSTWAANTTSALGSVMDTVARFKGVLVALSAVALLNFLSSAVAATASWGAALITKTAATVLSIARTIALTFAVSGYSVSATAATLATTALGGAMSLTAAAAAVIVAALAVVAVATVKLRAETKALNDESERMEGIFQRTMKPVLDIKDEISATEARVKNLKSALAQKGAVHVASVEDIKRLKEFNAAGGDTGWMKANQQRLATVRAEEQRLADALDKKNQKLKEAGELANKYKNALQGMEEKLREEKGTLGLDTDQVELWKAAHYGAGQALLGEIEAMQKKRWALSEHTKLQEAAKDEAEAVEASNRALGMSWVDQAEQLKKTLSPTLAYEEQLRQIDLLERKSLVSGYEAAKARINAWKELTEEGRKWADFEKGIQEEAARYNVETMSPAEKEAEAVARLIIMLQAGLVSYDTFVTKLAELRAQGNTGFAAIAESAKIMINHMDTALGEFVTKGKLNFKDLISSMLADIAKMLMSKALMQLLSMLGGSMQQSGGGSWVGMLGSVISAYAGGKASGGPVAAGSTYLVGERGPELFSPGSSGTIVPNGALGGGSTVNIRSTVVINQNGKAETSTSAQGGMDQAQARALGDSVNLLFDQWFARESRTGGKLYALMRRGG